MSALDTSLGQQEGFCNGAADITPAFSLPASALLFPGLLRDLDFSTSDLKFAVTRPSGGCPSGWCGGAVA